MTQLSLLSTPTAPARHTTAPPQLRSDYWVEPTGNIRYDKRHPYDPSLFAAIRRELADGPLLWGDLHRALADRYGHFALRAHVYRMTSTGEIEERERYWGASDPHDPAYRGWTGEYRITEAA